MKQSEILFYALKWEEALEVLENVDANNYPKAYLFKGMIYKKELYRLPFGGDFVDNKLANYGKSKTAFKKGCSRNEMTSCHYYYLQKFSGRERRGLSRVGSFQKQKRAKARAKRRHKNFLTNVDKNKYSTWYDFRMAWIFENVSKKPSEENRFLKRYVHTRLMAANEGDALAQFYLAKSWYIDDKVIAFVWYYLSSKNGHKISETYANRIKPHLTEQELLRAMELIKKKLTDMSDSQI